MPTKQENVQISHVINFKDNTFELFIFKGNNFLVFQLVYSKTYMVFQTSALGLRVKQFIAISSLKEFEKTKTSEFDSSAIFCFQVTSLG